MTKCVTIFHMEGGCSSLWVLTYLTFFRLPHVLVTLGATLEWNGWIVKICGRCWIALSPGPRPQCFLWTYYWCSITISPIQSPWIHWPPSGFKLLLSVVILGNNVKAADKTGCLKNHLKQEIDMKQRQNSFSILSSLPERFFFFK